jgi:hypothetical protein
MTLACIERTVPPRAPANRIVAAGCPFEGCQYGRWTATRTQHLFAEPEGLRLAIDVLPGDSIDAQSGEIYARPRRARVAKAGPDDRAQDIRDGDIVYALYPLGEGALALWEAGQMKSGSLDLVLDYDPPLPAGEPPLNWTWWVKVRLVDGTIAWLKDPKDFRGMDARAGGAGGAK